MPEKLRVSLSIIEKDAAYRDEYGGFKKEFPWLIQHLLPYSDRIRGCEAIFPPTVFFKGGIPAFLVKMDREFCLVSKPANKNLQNIQRDFSEVHKDGLKDLDGVFVQKYGAHINLAADAVPKFDFGGDAATEKQVQEVEKHVITSKDFSKLQVETFQAQNEHRVGARKAQPGN